MTAAVEMCGCIPPLTKHQEVLYAAHDALERVLREMMIEMLSGDGSTRLSTRERHLVVAKRDELRERIKATWQKKER